MTYVQRPLALLVLYLLDTGLPRSTLIVLDGGFVGQIDNPHVRADACGFGRSHAPPPF